MELPELVKIFDKINSTKLLYCYVCLRTEEERKLIDPVYLKKYMNILFPYTPESGISNESTKVCVYCEHRAQSAVRFHSALVCARNIYTLFQAVGANANLRFRLINAIRINEKTGSYQPQHKIEVIVKGVQAANNLKITRQKDLIQTEVLVVESRVFNRVAPNSEASIETVVIEDDEPKTTPNVPVQIVPMDNLLNSNSTIFSNMATLLPAENQIMLRNSNDTMYALHPVYSGPQGVSVVPTLSSYFVDGKLVPMTANTVLQSPVATTENVKTPDKNVPKNSGPKTYSRTKKKVVTSNVDNELDYLRNDDTFRDFVASTEIEDNDDDLTKVLKEVAEKYEKRSREELEKPNKRACFVNVRDLNDMIDTNEGNLTDNDSCHMRTVSKEPIICDSKVDWEDKIPMDVISFMDATDPNINNIIWSKQQETDLSSNMGIISEVRSITEMPADMECIDIT